jgi:hypothetical protein
MASIDAVIAFDTALKMRYETTLEVKFRRLFKDMSAEASAYYKNTQQLFDVRHYDKEVNALLRQHYRVVSNKFENRLREDLEKNFRHIEYKGLDDKVKYKLNDFINKRSLQQTYTISQTNSKELFNAYGSVYAQIGFQGVSPDVIAEEGSQAFERRAIGRAKTIAQTETQFIAEATKDIEALAITEERISINGETLSQEEITKTWNALLDEKTRLSHAEADYQIVQQNQPFIVQAQKLMFPGDTSMGATLDNIINCRCNSVRAIELSGLPEYVERPSYFDFSDRPFYF